jgi:hypothetical protein
VTENLHSETTNLPATKAEDKDRSMVDRMALMVAEAFADDSDLCRDDLCRDEALAALTDEDREVLAKMGTSAEVVGRVMARIKQPPLPQAITVWMQPFGFPVIAWPYLPHGRDLTG